MASASAPTIVGLDIGTTKICCLVGSLDDNQQVAVRGLGLAPSVGLRKGVIIDQQGTVEAIRRAADEAARQAGCALTGAYVYVGVTGDHVDSFTCHAAVRIEQFDHDILPADVDRVTALATAGVQKATRDILLERPRAFIVDGRRVADPLGLNGESLEVDLHVVTGERRFLQQVRSCVENVGLPVDSLVLEAVATGEAVLRPEERELGVVVVDLGGGTTDIAVYHEGQMVHTAAIAVGGAHVTADLSYALGATYQTAEDLKLRYGRATPDLCDPDGAIAYTNARGEVAEAEHALLAEVAGPRLEELFELVGRELRRAGYDLQRLAGGVVLAGGASTLPGVQLVARQVLGVLVREAKPRGIVEGAALVADPRFATAVGLVRLGGMDQAARLARIEDTSLAARLRTFWRNITRLFD